MAKQAGPGLSGDDVNKNDDFCEVQVQQVVDCPFFVSVLQAYLYFFSKSCLGNNSVCLENNGWSSTPSWFRVTLKRWHVVLFWSGVAQFCNSFFVPCTTWATRCTSPNPKVLFFDLLNLNTCVKHHTGSAAAVRWRHELFSSLSEPRGSHT